MPPHRTADIGDYFEYKRASVTVAGRTHVIVSKRGTFSHGRTDPASLMLATAAARRAENAMVVDLNCGNGMVGAAAACAGAARVTLTDRNIVNADAARRTMTDNGVASPDVHLCHGVPTSTPVATADLVTIRIPKERLALLQLLADAHRTLKPGGICLVAGATHEGIKTAANTLGALFGSERTIDRDAGHRLLSATKVSAHDIPPALLDSPYLAHDAFLEYDAELAGRSFRIFSRPGVFSWMHLDEATGLLANVMQVNPGESVLDIGCGAGALGTLAGTLSGDARVLMLDADIEAARSAERTAHAAGLTRAEVRASDVGAAVAGERFDVVVTNPPFHVGKATDLTVPGQFIADAHASLRTGGRMYLVANRTLPYERVVAERFGDVSTLLDAPRFKVLMTTRSD